MVYGRLLEEASSDNHSVGDSIPTLIGIEAIGPAVMGLGVCVCGRVTLLATRSWTTAVTGTACSMCDFLPTSL